MTAPKGFGIRKWIIDLPTARRFLALFKEPQRGVADTNRRWSPAVVNRYAVEMLAGRWGFSHEGFAFYGSIDDGTAEGQDGEQRCRALIQACTVGATAVDGTAYPPQPDFAFEVLVTEGLPREAAMVMNIGKPRTATDFLVMKGRVNGNVLSSTIQLCYSYDKEPPGAPFVADRWVKTSMTPLMREKYLQDNPDLEAALLEGAKLKTHMIPAAASAAFYLATKAKVDPQVLADFMESMRTGMGQNWTAENPVLRLREMLTNARDSKRRYNREEQLALFIKAFNAYAKGAPIRRQMSWRTKKVMVVRQGRVVEMSPEAFPRFLVD